MNTGDDHYHNRPFIISELLTYGIQRWKIGNDLKKQWVKATNQAELERNSKFEKEIHEFDHIEEEKKTDNNHHDRPFIFPELLASEIQRWKISHDLKKQLLKITNQAELERNSKFEQELHEFDHVEEDKK